MKKFLKFVFVRLFLAFLGFLCYRFLVGVWVRVGYGEVVVVNVPSYDDIYILHQGNYFVKEGFIPKYVKYRRFPSYMNIRFEIEEYPPLVEFLHIKDDMAIIFSVNLRISFTDMGYKKLFLEFRDLDEFKRYVRKKFVVAIRGIVHKIFENKDNLPTKLQDVLNENIYQKVMYSLKNEFSQEGIMLDSCVISVEKYPDMRLYKTALFQLSRILQKKIEYEERMLKLKYKELEYKSEIERYKKLAKVVAKNPIILKLMMIDAMKGSKVIFPSWFEKLLEEGKGR